MSTREARAFDRLKDKILRPTDRFERIENGLAPGWPDVNYCFSGIEGWIELKAPIEPAREETRLFGSQHGISVDQANWFLKQRRAGGRGFLLIVTDKRVMLFNACLIADDLLSLNEMSVPHLASIAKLHFTAPVKDGMSWVQLRGVLTD